MIIQGLRLPKVFEPLGTALNSCADHFNNCTVVGKVKV